MPGFYKLEDTNGDDVMDRIERISGYAATGMGDHGPHAIRRGPDGSIMFLIGNNTYVGSRSADGQVNDDAVDTDSSPNWNNVEERQFLPQFNDPRFGNSTRTGVHATVWRLQPNGKYSLFFSGMRNPYDFAFNLAGEAFTFDSDMEWDVNAPWYREVRTVHMVPGGDGGYRNGTGKFQDEYFDIDPGAPPPAARLAGRRRVLSELRLSGEVLRQPVRGRLVARPAALQRADARAARPTADARISPSSCTASRCRSPTSRSGPTATST